MRRDARITRQLNAIYSTYHTATSVSTVEPEHKHAYGTFHDINLWTLQVKK